MLRCDPYLLSVFKEAVTIPGIKIHFNGKEGKLNAVENLSEV